MVSYLKNKKCAVVIAIAMIGIVAAIVSPIVSQSYEPFPSEALPGESIGRYLPYDFGASGIIWHPRLETFFIVGDGGTVSSMCDKGINFSHWQVGGDLEAITIVCPQSDFIYIGKENSDQIYEFCLKTNRVHRAFDLTAWMQGPNNAGLEALTFVPDATDSEGGLFYAGLQDTGEIFIFRLPLRSSATSTDVTHIKTIPAINGIIDISAMYYKAAHDVIYAVYDDENLLRAMKTDGTVIREWALPGENQEGITLRSSELFICIDSKEHGDIFRYAPFKGINQPMAD